MNLIQAILLDIEGTTTPISFVHEVLFPYSRDHLDSFLKQHSQAPAVLNDLQMLKREHAADVAAGNSPAPLVNGYVRSLISQDRKSPALKSLQGKIWERGYSDGSLQASVFSDVVPAIKRWKEEGKTINIFSSGSVLAQKLLFAHTNAGDLTNLITEYFDTGVGKKNEPASYQRIASTLNRDPAAICFFSDVVAELNAAADAGMKTLLCVRPGNHPQENNGRHRAIHSFVEA